MLLTVLLSYRSRSCDAAMADLARGCYEAAIRP